MNGLTLLMRMSASRMGGSMEGMLGDWMCLGAAGASLTICAEGGVQGNSNCDRSVKTCGVDVDSGSGSGVSLGTNVGSKSVSENNCK